MSLLLGQLLLRERKVLAALSAGSRMLEVLGTLLASHMHSYSHNLPKASFQGTCCKRTPTRRHYPLSCQCILLDTWRPELQRLMNVAYVRERLVRAASSPVQPILILQAV
jgi:hypothetical protein